MPESRAGPDIVKPAKPVSYLLRWGEEGEEGDLEGTLL